MRSTAVRALLVASLLLASAGTGLAPSAAGAAEAPRTTGAQWALRWRADEAAAAEAGARAAAAAEAPQPPEVLAVSRLRLQAAVADYDRRQALRDEQFVVYALAVDPALQAAAERSLPAGDLPGIRSTISGLRALWASAGIDDLAEVHPRTGRDLAASAPVDVLRGYYAESQRSSGVDWTYLAAINFIESDFGRNNGPSSAGARGPMQFMPATWSDYGQGGDIDSPHDSIQAAGRYLRKMGAPAAMDRAIFRYNNDLDYVASVESFAAAMRTDPAWLQRLYLWGTAG